MPTNEEIVRTACQVIWSEGQIDRVPEFYHEDFTADYPNANWGTGLDGVKTLAAGVRVGLPDYSEHIDLLIDDGKEHVVVELTISGTHNGPMMGLAPTGKAVSFRDVTILRIKDGRIIEQRGLTDYLSIMQQLDIKAVPGA